MTAPQIVQPVDASTVILVRPGRLPSGAWECFMVRRHVKSDFAADVYVFPGGKVDPEDGDKGLLQHVVGPPESGEGDAELWLPLRLCAVRELFEETGVLLARHPDGSKVAGSPDEVHRLQNARRALHAGELMLSEMAAREDLVFSIDTLHQISRWITPPSFPRRFDTRFFVAEHPEGQEPLHDALETTDGVWVAPGEALAAFAQGTFPLVFATERHLQLLSRFSSIEELIAATANADLTPVTPRVIRNGDEPVFLIPGDPGYETAEVGTLQS